MQTILNLMLHSLRSQRGVVSMEWLILGAVVMAAIVLAFAPTFQTALTDGVTSVSGILQTQIGAGGS